MKYQKEIELKYAVKRDTILLSLSAVTSRFLEQTYLAMEGVQLAQQRVREANVDLNGFDEVRIRADDGSYSLTAKRRHGMLDRDEFEMEISPELYRELLAAQGGLTLHKRRRTTGYLVGECSACADIDEYLMLNGVAVQPDFLICELEVLTQDDALLLLQLMPKLSPPHPLAGAVDVTGIWEFSNRALASQGLTFNRFDQIASFMDESRSMRYSTRDAFAAVSTPE